MFCHAYFFAAYNELHLVLIFLTTHFNPCIDFDVETCDYVIFFVN